MYIDESCYSFTKYARASAPATKSSTSITRSRSSRKAFPAAVLQSSPHAVLGSCQPWWASGGHVGTDCGCTQGVMVGLGEEEGKEREREAGEEPSEPLSAVAVTAATPVGMGEGGGPAEKEEWGREEEEPLRSPAGRASCRWRYRTILTRW